MADGDNAKLLIVLEAQSKKLQNQLVAGTRQIDRFAAQTNKRFDMMNAKNAASFDRLNSSVTRSLGGLSSALAPLLGALGTREIIGYADAWTTAGNKIAAAGQVAGRQGRSLEAINDIANDTRSGIVETTDLYAKLLRATKDVAKSEEDVARATSIVNKAFKAGGAAASEQTAGILQLAQGLGSGILQGDELRSIRENAPLLAQAIADEFGTTIAGLKQLGAEGKLTSERIFQAILKSQSSIEAAFNTTNATIGDSFTKVNNAMTQYIGTADQSKGATYALQAGLTALADNFETIADVTLKVAAVISAALVGRAIGGMIISLGAAGASVAKFVAIARTAQGVGGLLTAIGGLGAVAAPIAAVVGTIAAGAVGYFAAQAVEASQRTERFNEMLIRMGIVAKESADQIDEATAAQNRLSTAKGIAEHQQDIEDTAGELERFNAEIEKMIALFRGAASAGNDQAQALVDQIDEFKSGEKSAADLNAELDELAKQNPDWADAIASLQSLITNIENATTAATKLAASLPGGVDPIIDPDRPAQTRAGMLNFQRGPRLDTDLGDFPDWNKPATYGTLGDFRGAGGSGKKDKKTPDEAFKDALASQREENRLLVEKTALQATLNPLVEDYGLATEKLRIQQELQSAATKAGIALTPELKATIDELASGYAIATVEAAKLAEAQDNAKQSMLDWFDLGKSATRGFIDDLIEGKSAAEALGGAFQKLGEKLLDMGLDALFGSGQGASPFGAIGKIFGFAAKGGIAENGKLRKFAGGGVSNSAAIFGEAGPEAAVPLPDGRRIPVDLRMPTKAGASSGNTTVSIPITIDATGADAAGLARVEQKVAELKASLPGVIKQTVGRRAKDIW